MRSAKMYFTMKSNATPRLSSLEKAKANGFLSRDSSNSIQFNMYTHPVAGKSPSSFYIFLSNIFYTFFQRCQRQMLDCGGVLRVWVPRHQTAFIIDPTTHSVIKRSSRKKRKVPDRLSLCAGTKNWGINNLTLGIRTSNHSQPFHVGPKIPKELRITCSIWTPRDVL